MARSQSKALDSATGMAHADSVENGREWGRKAILAGWIITMAGIVGYVFAMLRAPQDTGLLEALFSQGFLGWLSAVLLLGGVSTWVVGNLAFFRTVLEEPSKDPGDNRL